MLDWKRDFRMTAVTGIAAMALAVTLTPVATALANMDNGGNGNGKLLIEAQGSETYTTTLVKGQTYDFVLANPGGHTKEVNLKYVPRTLTFSFYDAKDYLHGNPGKQHALPIFSLKGSEIGKSSPYEYAVTIPENVKAGDFTIITGAPKSNGGDGEDEFYFSTDPSVINLEDNTAGQLPETPYASLFAGALAVGAVIVWMRRRTVQH